MKTVTYLLMSLFIPGKTILTNFSENKVTGNISFLRDRERIMEETMEERCYTLLLDIRQEKTDTLADNGLV